MASPTLERVRKLVALAASPEREEARTSAVLVCRLIREHGLHVVEEVAPPRAPAPPPKNDPLARPRVIRAKFECKCVECALTIEAGERCAWLKGRGCWDLECYREVWS